MAITVPLKHHTLCALTLIHSMLSLFRPMLTHTNTQIHKHTQVFSKLQEGRMPTAGELLTAMGLPVSPVQQEQ